MARILVIDAHAVPHFAVIRPRESPARTEGRDRIDVHDPVHHVDVVHSLLDDLVAAEPDEVHPVVELILGIAHALGPRAVPDASRAVAGRGPDDVADRTLANLLHGADVVRLPAILRAGDDGRAAGDRLVVRLQADAISRRIDAGRLLGEDMLPRLDRLSHIRGPKAGRHGQEHDVDARVIEHPFVAVEPAIHPGVLERHLFLVRSFQHLAKRRALRNGEIGRRHELHMLVDRQRVVHRARSAAAAADDAQPQFATFLGGSNRRMHHQPSGNGGRRADPEKSAPTWAGAGSVRRLVRVASEMTNT
jgi:hypothetical protein